MGEESCPYEKSGRNFDQRKQERAMNEGNESSYTTGYGKPPKATRFRNGESGNPQGRPKDRPNMATVIQRTLDAKVVIDVDGERREVTMLEAAMMELANKAVAGDLRALNMVATFARMAELRTEQEETGKSGFEEADKQVLKNFIEKFKPTSTRRKRQ